MIFDNILNLKKKKILEVGAGISYFTMELAKKHEYEVIEYSNSKDKQSYRKLESLLNRNFYINNDWCNQEVNSFYDYIIANDLFPNVDQRLDLFIDKYINKCNTLKFLLTYSDNTFFEVRRNSTNETLFWKAWGKYEINNFFTRLFKKYDFIETFEEIQHLISYKSLKDIVFTNHRNCIYVEIKKV